MAGPNRRRELGTAEERFFCNLERERTNALVVRDMATIERLHAQDCELVTPAGRVFTRAEYLAAITAEPFYTSGRTMQCWHMDAYRRTQGQWQAVWSQATEFKSAGARAGADAGAGAAPLAPHGVQRRT